MTNIIVELDPKDTEANAPAIEALGGNATVVPSERFDGVLVVQVMAAINGVTLPLLAKLISDAIRANRYVVVKKKGLEVKGLSADDAIKVLRELKDD